MTITVHKTTASSTSASAATVAAATGNSSNTDLGGYYQFIQGDKGQLHVKKPKAAFDVEAIIHKMSATHSLMPAVNQSINSMSTFNQRYSKTGISLYNGKPRTFASSSADSSYASAAGSAQDMPTTKSPYLTKTYVENVPLQQLAAILDAYKYNGDIKSLVAIAYLDHHHTAFINLQVGIELHHKVATYARTRIIEVLSIELSMASPEFLYHWALSPTLVNDLAAWAKECFQFNLDIYDVDRLKQVIQMIVQNRQTDRTLPIIEEGPLNKNSATRFLEKIISKAEQGQLLWSTSAKHRHELFVTVDEREYNVTYLMAEANLDQLASENPSDELTPEEKTAVFHYTASNYEWTNEFLRTGKISDVNLAQVVFLDTIRITRALHKLSQKQHEQYDQRFAQLKEAYTLVYGVQRTNAFIAAIDIIQWAIDHEKITSAIARHIIERKVIGAFRQSDFIPEGLNYADGFIAQSTAALSSNITLFQNKTKKSWSTSGVSIRHLSNHDHESEILISHGKQYAWIRMGETVIAHEINTPSLSKPNAYHWMRALQIANDTHLSKPYLERLTCHDVPAYGVARPNHGLPHSSRKLYYLDAVITFFAKHANKVESRNFFKSLTIADIDKLKCSLAFSVTGRESEISRKDNNEKYMQFRNQSKDNFRLYALHEQWSVHDINTFSELFDYQSDPTNDPAGLLYMATSFAHALDLLRCYTPEEMREATSPFYPSHSPLPDQLKQDWFTLFKYTQLCITATGDRLISRMQDDNGTFVIANYDYDQRIFLQANADILTCQYMIRAVPLYKVSNEVDQFPQKIIFHYAQHRAQHVSDTPFPAQIELQSDVTILPKQTAFITNPAKSGDLPSSLYNPTLFSLASKKDEFYKLASNHLDLGQ